MRTAIAIIPMTDAHHTISLLRLQAWMSTSFPTGGFAYSHGLERAMDDGVVQNRQDLENWIWGLVSAGSLHNDAILLKEAWSACFQQDRLDGINDCALAMAASKERLLETTSQADAFARAVQHWSLPESFYLPSPVAYPLAIGTVAGAFAIPLFFVLTAFLQNAINNQCQAAIRLSIIGQNGAASILGALEGRTASLVERISAKTMEDLGSGSFQADIMAMNHEHQQVRLFRS